MTTETNELFPLSKQRKIKGTRRIAREKTLQILIAHKISEVDVEMIFPHVFFRIFNFSEEDEQPSEKRLLRPDEIIEIESDTPIKWKDEDIKFGTELIRHTIKGEAEFDKLIEEFAVNWELDRIALIDRVLMHIAIAEFVHFNEIPPKVSVNEAIEISKVYSTEKSSIFINGILDSVLARLKKEGKVNKVGRGLIEK